MVCGVNKVRRADSGIFFLSSFGIEIADLYSLTAPTIARKEAAPMAREAYGKRKTRLVAATKEQVAADAKVNPLPEKFVRQPETAAFGSPDQQKQRRQRTHLAWPRPPFRLWL